MQVKRTYEEKLQRMKYKPEQKVEVVKRKNKKRVCYRGYTYCNHLNMHVSLENWLRIVDNAHSQKMKLHTFIRKVASISYQ